MPQSVAGAPFGVAMTSTADRVNRLTAEQQQAIAANSVSVSLSAGAGCGKTFVLTERFLAHFDPLDPAALGPADLGRLVAITFTERAAREMRDRIRAKCYERLLTAESEAASDYWSDLLRSLDAARISTIHSFCGSLLRSRAVEAQLDPQFAVLEQAQADTLLSKVIDDVLRQLVADHDPLTVELAARFDLRVLDEMLHDLVRGCTPAEFDDWRGVSPDEQLTRWSDYHRTTVLTEIGRDLVDSPAALAVRDGAQRSRTGPSGHARAAATCCWRDWARWPGRNRRRPRCWLIWKRYKPTPACRAAAGQGLGQCRSL